MRFIVKQTLPNNRLDKFLTQKIKDQTRSQIKKMIEQGLILVNQKPASVHEFLKAGDIIESKKKSVKKQLVEKIAKRFEKIISPEIIFENHNFIVLNKPVGLLVHPTDKGETNTLVDWLVKKYPDIKLVGENKYRAGIIHRLDKDVSGVIVAAKNNAAFRHIKEQFKKRNVKKEYLAIVYGKMTEPAGEINLPIGRNKDGQFVAHPRRGEEKFQNEDKVAKTKYEVIELVKDYSVLKVEILTGRTHQIRAHLSAIGHPVIGDQLYKPKKKIFTFLRRRIKVVDPGRIMLHSQKIGFYNLNNDWVEFSAPIPQQITNFINDQKK